MAKHSVAPLARRADAVGRLGGAAALGEDVEADGHARGLGGGPERVEVRLVVGRLGVGADGDGDAGEPDLLATVKLADRGLNVVDGDETDSLERVGVGLHKVRHPRVVGAEAGELVGDVGDGEHAEGDGGVEHLGLDAVGCDLADAGAGIVGALGGVGLVVAEVGDLIDGPAGGGDRADLDQAHAAVALEHVLVVLALAMGRTALELGLDVVEPEVGRLDHVRVGRDDLLGSHGALLCPVPDGQRATPRGGACCS